MSLKNAKNLLDQIIEEAEHEDNRHKIRAIKDANGEQAIGQSWMIYHLNVLKKLLNEEEKELKEVLFSP